MTHNAILTQQASKLGVSLAVSVKLVRRVAGAGHRAAVQLVCIHSNSSTTTHHDQQDEIRLRQRKVSPQVGYWPKQLSEVLMVNHTVPPDGADVNAFQHVAVMYANNRWANPAVLGRYHVPIQVLYNE